MATAADAAGHYTSLESADCRVTEVDGETGDSTSICPGLAGYRLQVQDADARMSIDVITAKNQRYPLVLASAVGSGFSSLGPRAEWRFGADRRTPAALVFRYRVHESAQVPERVTSYLVIARLTGGTVCVVAKIAPGLDQNRRAREIADGAADAACLLASAR